MKQKECVMPEYCIGCGRVFDLWSHLLMHAKNSRTKKEESHKIYDEFLCDECRRSMKLNEEEYIDIEENEAGEISMKREGPFFSVEYIGEEDGDFMEKT